MKKRRPSLTGEQSRRFFMGISSYPFETVSDYKRLTVEDLQKRVFLVSLDSAVRSRVSNASEDKASFHLVIF